MIRHFLNFFEKMDTFLIYKNNFLSLCCKYEIPANQVLNTLFFFPTQAYVSYKLVSVLLFGVSQSRTRVSPSLFSDCMDLCIRILNRHLVKEQAGKFVNNTTWMVSADS